MGLGSGPHCACVRRSPALRSARLRLGGNVATLMLQHLFHFELRQCILTCWLLSSSIPGSTRPSSPGSGCFPAIGLVHPCIAARHEAQRCAAAVNAPADRHAAASGLLRTRLAVPLMHSQLIMATLQTSDVEPVIWTLPQPVSQPLRPRQAWPSAKSWWPQPRAAYAPADPTDTPKWPAFEPTWLACALI